MPDPSPRITCTFLFDQRSEENDDQKRKKNESDFTVISGFELFDPSSSADVPPVKCDKDYVPEMCK